MKSFKIKKVLLIILLVMTVMFFLKNVAYADHASTMKDLIGEVDQKEDNSGADTAANNIMGTIVVATRIVTAAIGVVILIILAAKYMIGGASDKAEVKKSAAIYIFGSVILFGTSAILTLIQNISEKTLPQS